MVVYHEMADRTASRTDRQTITMSISYVWPVPLPDNEGHTDNTGGTPDDFNCNLDVPVWVTRRSVRWKMTLFIGIGSSS